MFINFYLCFRAGIDQFFVFKNMKFILGKKMPMTQIWEDDKVVAVTPVLAGPCVITQVKAQGKDKYSALQLAFGSRKSKNLKKPQKQQFAKAGVSPMHVREFRLNKDVDANIGDQINLESFVAGDTIQVTGTSKGKGFQGVVKRHGFKGGDKSHGNKDQLRMPGSIGAKGPAHVFKGMKMGGRMGGDRVTIKNLSIASVDLENNIIYIRGAVPGAINGLLQIKGEGELLIKAKPENTSVKEEENNNQVKEAKELKGDDIKAANLESDVKEELKKEEGNPKEEVKEKKEKEKEVEKEESKESDKVKDSK